MQTQRSILSIFACLIALSAAGCGHADSQAANDGDNDTADAIVRGKNINSKGQAAKSVVAIVSQIQEGQALCTGTLIDSSTVLTAAHCVDQDPEKLMVVFGAHIKTAGAANMREATAFAQNPRWKKPTTRGKGDLALIHFEGGVPSGFQPVQLANKSATLNEGTSVLMVGYGVTNGLSHAGAGVLRETQTTIVGNASPTEVITDGRKSSVCFGDSGGPAFVGQGKDLAQWGIASSVTSESCNEASIHTSVITYVRWIKSTAQKLSTSGTSNDGLSGAPPQRKRHLAELITDDDE